MSRKQSLSPLQKANLELADEVAKCYADPFRFVMLAYPWGEKGSLEDEKGPDTWQKEVLIEIGEEVRSRRFNGRDPVMPIREAIGSGHGIGKSTLVAWINDWILSTRPNSKGTVTANTFTQLQSKTWAAIQRWAKLCITSHWFEVTGNRVYFKQSPESWFSQAQTCREENSEAFAGQHAADSTSFYIFDEASAIPDKIWEVAEGGMTDGESMIFAFGNVTRSSGKFYKITFGDDKNKWKNRHIDSRTVERTNKTLIEQWIRDYGEDSDFVRVRVKGLPPRASELQFIDSERVIAAQKRIVEVLPDEPLIAGFDVSGGGSAWNVIRFRRGLDARSIPPIRIPGEKGRDRSVLIGIAAEVLRNDYNGHKVAAMFVDSAFGAAIVERLHTMGFRNVHEVNFGGPSPDHVFANWRAFMWGQGKDWLLRGAIDSSSQLEIGLTCPGYHVNKSNKLVLESKADMVKRGEASPDDADAHCLTFAQRVAPRKPEPVEPQYAYVGGGHGSGGGWMG